MIINEENKEQVDSKNSTFFNLHPDTYDLEENFRFESEMKRSEVKKIFDLWKISIQTRDKPTFALETYLMSLGVPFDVLEEIKGGFETERLYEKRR